ncbi:MAG: hypothetical protein U0R65_02585 [Candidatus Nanopelagicales bacterium]
MCQPLTLEQLFLEHYETTSPPWTRGDEHDHGHPAAVGLRDLDGRTAHRAWRLTRSALRRDRIRLSAWVLGIGATLVLTAQSFPSLYPDAASWQQRAEVMASPAAVAIGGPGIGAADYTFGAMLTNEMLALTAAFVALMAIFTVTRHTRADEEAGRTELVLANPVGRDALLAAAVTVAVLASLAVGIVAAVDSAASDFASIDWPGSFLYGGALASLGIAHGRRRRDGPAQRRRPECSASPAWSSARSYAVRAVGDVTGTDAVSWLSPFAWAQRTYAFVDDRCRPLGSVGAPPGRAGRRSRLPQFPARPRSGMPASSAPSTDRASWVRRSASRLAPTHGAHRLTQASLLCFGLMYGTPRSARPGSSRRSSRSSTRSSRTTAGDDPGVLVAPRHDARDDGLGLRHHRDPARAGGGALVARRVPAGHPGVAHTGSAATRPSVRGASILLAGRSASASPPQPWATAPSSVTGQAPPCRWRPSCSSSDSWSPCTGGSHGG